MPIVAGVVSREDVPIFLDGLGTVRAFNTVTVRARVDGQVQKIAFAEGQAVRKGDVIAQIDPAPFQARLDQSLARKAEDEARLEIARITLKRDGELLDGKILSQQDFDTQQALVKQLEATVKGDQATVDDAKVQLEYTRITSPIDGRTGMRMVDEGNLVRANDSNGIVVITQLHPISVVFSLPEQSLGQIQERLATGAQLEVLSLDRDNTNVLGRGTLAVLDNQIDTSTGTLRLKATFPNDDLRLWPGQFINARLLLDTRKDGVVVPAQVVQHGPDGTYAYIIDADMTARVQPIKVALVQEGKALIDYGLQPGERVVVDGQYKLEPGSKVQISSPAQPAQVEAPSVGGQT